jgi:DNA uptake protein ComE-like DNA-binding protein
MVLDKIVIDQMEQDGHVFLHRVGTDYYFRMPFLFIFVYDQYLHIIPRELAEVAFNHDNKVTWQGWESFNALFQVFMNNFLHDEQGTSDISLGDFYYMADGQDDTKNLCIKLEPLEVAYVKHQFPSLTQPVVDKDTGKSIDWTTCSHVLLNGKYAQFGDTVLIRATEKQTAKKYFGRKVDTIIISGQQKWDYNGEYFTLKQAKNEHNKALETAAIEGLPKSFGIITVIFTTQPLRKDKIQKIPKDILIIHQGNFKNYYGPFATRAAFSIAHTFNPNFADIQHLEEVLEGVGEETAKEIAKERQKRPFTSMDDFCGRVKRAKGEKFTRQLTFFPFGSKRLLLPFEDYPDQETEE